MRYRKLDSDGDFTFGHGVLGYYIDQPEAPAQAILTRLRLFTPEWFLNHDEGTPYKTHVLGKYTNKTWENAIKNRIRKTPHVRNIKEFSSSFDPDNRTATFNVTVDTDFGVHVLKDIEISMLPLYGR